MAYLYLLSESDNDAVFFKACVERLMGALVQLVPLKLRPGSGVSRFRSNSRLMLQHIQRSGNIDETFFLIAWDNDRSPIHPTHEQRPGLSEKEKQKTCRFCKMDSMIRSVLGARDEWPIPGAIAVPVESWLLLICNPEQHRDEASLPLFANKDEKLARDFYAPRKSPDQLKDLCDIEKKERGIDSMMEFVVYCAQRVDPDDLAARAPSFALFKQRVEETGRPYGA